MDAVLSFVFDNAYLLFGAMIVAFLALMWFVGRPTRWWKWLVQAWAVGSIAFAIFAIWFFAGIASALDHRLASLQFTEYGSTTTHKLSDFRGKVVFVNYWATWCPPCRKEMPDISKLADAYRGKDVVILALTDEEAEVIQRYTAKYPIHATVAKFTSDKPRGGIESFVYQGRPTTLILDANGKVTRRFIGMRTFEQFDAAIRKAM